MPKELLEALFIVIVVPICLVGSMVLARRWNAFVDWMARQPLDDADDLFLFIADDELDS